MNNSGIVAIYILLMLAAAFLCQLDMNTALAESPNAIIVADSHAVVQLRGRRPIFTVYYDYNEPERPFQRIA